jgi:hypothetical protein
VILNHNQIKNKTINKTRINNNHIIIITKIITIIPIMTILIQIVKMDGMRMGLKKGKENLLYRLEC